MTEPRFLQIHALTSYSASLLNRDDAGFAKRIPFGGATRTRVSSQCLKRHWRVFDGEGSLRKIAAPASIRSRRSFEEYIVKPLVQEGTSQDIARAATEKLIGVLLGGDAKKAKAAKGKAKAAKGKAKDAEATEEADESAIETAQVTVLGRQELDYLATLAREACADAKDAGSAAKAMEKCLKDKSLKQNLDALLPGKLQAGLSAALFGRMVTGDILARTDAAIHVAHAFTVHAQQSESDYFSAIDDLAQDQGEAGSGHINATELTSGLFYGYVVLDLQLLGDNVGGDTAMVREVTERLLRMIATVSPGAKLGSTAPYAYSHLVMAESGRAQPRSLANAFLKPVSTSGSVVANAYTALRSHVDQLDNMYGCDGERAYAGIDADGLFADTTSKMPLAELAKWAGQRAHSAIMG